MNNTRSKIIIFDLNIDILIINYILNRFFTDKEALKINEIISDIDDKITIMNKIMYEFNLGAASKIRGLIAQNPQVKFIPSNYKCDFLTYYWGFIWHELLENRQPEYLDIE